MTISQAIAAQFDGAVSDTIAEARLGICEQCPHYKVSSWAGGEVGRCSECECLLSINGKPDAVLGFKPKTRVRGQRCPEGKW